MVNAATGGPGEAHGPATCATVKAWLQREVDSGENSKWLKANTKTCPRCYQNIEKNQGCTVSLALALAAPNEPALTSHSHC